MGRGQNTASGSTVRCRVLTFILFAFTLAHLPMVPHSTDCNTYMGAHLSTSSPLGLYRPGSQQLALSFHLHICLSKQVTICTGAQKQVKHVLEVSHSLQKRWHLGCAGVLCSASAVISHHSGSVGEQWVPLAPLGTLSLSPQMWTVSQRMWQWRNSPSKRVLGLLCIPLKQKQPCRRSLVYSGRGD